MADIGEELRLQFVEPGELLPLSADLILKPALLGDVAAFADQEPDVAVPIPDRGDIEIDCYNLGTARAPDDIDVVPDKFSRSGARDRQLQLRTGLGRRLPPAGFPEWPPVDAGSRVAGALQRSVVDVPHHPLRIKPSAELEHVVQRHP